MPLLICYRQECKYNHQTIYWTVPNRAMDMGYGYIGANEYAILDSVEREQRRYKEKTVFWHQPGMSIYILCAEKGPVNLFFDIEPNTNWKLKLMKTWTEDIPHPMKGNDMFNEFLTFYNTNPIYRKKSEDQSQTRRQHTNYYKAN